MQSSAETLPHVDPPTGGILSALLDLARPLSGVLLEPTIGAEPFRSVPRRLGGTRELRMDLYLPAEPAGAPSCLLVHGGGFVIGHRAMKPVRIAAHELVRRGVAVASIDYRLLQHGGTLRVAVEDVLAALEHWMGRAAQLSLDPRRVSVAGFSAGAALTLLAASRAGEGLAGVASVYGPTDFSRVSGRRARLLARWVTEAEHASEIRARSPVSHAHFEAPLLVVHGTADVMIAPAQARVLVDGRRERGLVSRYVAIEGAPHGFFAREGSPYVEQAADALATFLHAPGA